jgi:cytochrome c biogenesis protein CcmG/thiol:disulfide interchange protein DsbE
MLGKLALYQLSYVPAGQILGVTCAGGGRPAARSIYASRAMGSRPFLAVIAVLAVVGLLAFGLLKKGASGAEIGSQAPAGALPQLDGAGQGSLADYRGRWVLVNFWASWCVPCRQESPALQDFQERHAGRRFTVLGVDTRDLTGDGRAFVREFGLTYPQLRDGNGDEASDYGTTGVPENFLVDPRGRLRLLRRGPVTEAYLKEFVEPLLPRSGGGA